MEEAYYHGRCAVRAQPVGAPISARSLKNLNGEDSAGDRPQSSSPQNAAAVGSSARHRAGDCPSQSSSFTCGTCTTKANVELSGQLTAGARSRRQEHVCARASTESEEASEGAGDDAGEQPREVQRHAAFVQRVLVGRRRGRLGDLHRRRGEASPKTRWRAM
jgi:hypothetical protein